MRVTAYYFTHLLFFNALVHRKRSEPVRVIPQLDERMFASIFFCDIPRPVSAASVINQKLKVLCRIVVFKQRIKAFADKLFLPVAWDDPKAGELILFPSQ